MSDFLAGFAADPLPGIAVGLAGIIAVLLILLLASIRKLPRRTQIPSADAFAEELAGRLDEVLAERWGRDRRESTAETERALKAVMELAATVMKRSELSSAEAAKAFAGALEAELKGALETNARLADRVRADVAEFGRRLETAAAESEKMAAGQAELFRKTAVTVPVFLESMRVCGGEVSKLGTTLGDTARTLEETREALRETAEIAADLRTVATRFDAALDRGAETLVERNEAVTALLSRSAAALEEAGERAAEAVALAAGDRLERIARAQTELARLLEDLPARLEAATVRSAETADALSRNLMRDAEAACVKFAEEAAKSAEAEYDRLIRRAEEHSEKAAESLARMAETVDRHVFDLNNAVRMLSEHIETFRQSGREAADRFERGMSASLENALSQIDTALAAIADRLVRVTAQIERAAVGTSRADDALQ